MIVLLRSNSVPLRYPRWPQAIPTASRRQTSRLRLQLFFQRQLRYYLDLGIFESSLLHLSRPLLLPSPGFYNPSLITRMLLSTGLKSLGFSPLFPRMKNFVKLHVPPKRMEIVGKLTDLDTYINSYPGFRSVSSSRPLLYTCYRAFKDKLPLLSGIPVFLSHCSATRQSLQVECSTPQPFILLCPGSLVPAGFSFKSAAHCTLCRW